uniref:DNA methyltransferase n=1 Tax=Psychrobacter sp. TaxID=56811 RepID=UPI0015EE5D3A|nr:DNA methyltransferase [Psychrobacter sp.]
MKEIKECSIDLIYLDPPFFSNRTHTLKNRTQNKYFSFDDTWENNASYAEFLKNRIEIMHSLLKPTGSIFVHCDKSGEHIVRAVLDSVFGSENFQSEIIWTYKRWSNSKKGLLPSHQNIYFYSKSKDFKFNKIFKPYSETTNVDQILQSRTRDIHNKSVYAKDSSGMVKNGESKKGVPLGDVWDIPYLNPKAKERVSYPTQKPILLLEQIINLVTDEGDLVLDPFCGSGTTCVASKLLSRDFIGIDESEDAVTLSYERLANPIKTESNLLKKGRNSYVNADIEALNHLQGVKFNPVQRNKGIDAILVEQFEGSPILVRIQKHDESLSQAASLLAKAMKTKNSKRSILIKTVASDLLEATINFEGLEVISSSALQIAKLIKESS